MAGGSVVGLDIGSSQIKVVEMKRSGGGVEITAMEVAPTPLQAMENGEITDAQMLGRVVKELLSKAKISAKKVVSSVSGQNSVVVRVIEVPQMKPAELEETMKWEVERQVPFNVNESIVDFKKIDRPEGYAEGQNMDVLLAVARQDMIDRHVEMLFAAGLKPSAIDVEPLAGGRALLELAPDYGSMPGHTVAVVNIGATYTDVAIFRDKLLVFPRSLPLAGDNFTRAIADALGVDIQSAEAYKRDYAEVIFGQQQANTFGGGDTGDFGGGFMDFGAAPDADFAPTVAEETYAPAASPPTAPAGSGKMPFDFSTPGDEAPLPEPSGPLSPSGFAPTPFDLSGDAPSEPSASPFMTSMATEAEAPVPTPFGTPTPFDTTNQFASAPQPDFSPTPDFSPAPNFGQDFAAPAANLPVPAQTGGDPAREAMRVQVFNAIAPILAELVQEMRRSIDFYRGRSIDPTIHEMLLVGGTAKIPNLAAFLESELGVPTRVANPLQSVQVSTKNYSQGVLDEMAPLFPVSIGLGARDLVAVPAAKKQKRGK